MQNKKGTEARKPPFPS